MTKRFKRGDTLVALGGFAISLLFLGLALYRVDFIQVAQAIARADYRLVVASGCMTLASYVARTMRWRRLLLPQKAIPTARLFPVVVIGFALNNVLPGRPGEIARGFALGQRERLSKTAGIATVVLERVADGLTLIAILAGLSLLIDLPGWGRQVESLSLLIFGAALLFMLLMLWREKWMTHLLHRVIHVLPPRFAHRIANMFASFVIGLHSLRSPRDVLAIAVFSLSAWLCEACSYFLVLSAFNLLAFPAERLYASLFMMVIVNLSISIPAAPGGVGPFEWAGSLALAAFGVMQSLALPVVLVSHMVQFALVTGLGFLFMAREGINLTRSIASLESRAADDLANAVQPAPVGEP
jgi:uncharacterized protein (TIRG00374 family)